MEKEVVGKSFRVFLEGQPLDGVAKITEHYDVKYGTNERTTSRIDIDVFGASQRDIDFVRSMHSLSSTGTNFVRIMAFKYESNMPVEELSVALALMGESLYQFEGLTLQTVNYQMKRLPSGGQTINMEIKAVQTFAPPKKVSS